MKCCTHNRIVLSTVAGHSIFAHLINSETLGRGIRDVGLAYFYESFMVHKVDDVSMFVSGFEKIGCVMGYGLDLEHQCTSLDLGRMKRSISYVAATTPITSSRS